MFKGNQRPQLLLQGSNRLCSRDIVHYSHNSGCCKRSVAPWIAVLSWHTVFTKRVIYYKFTLVWYSTKQSTMRRPAPHLAHLYAALSFTVRRTQRAAHFGLMIWLASVCYGDRRVTKHFFCPHFFFQPIWGWEILALYSFLTQIPHQKEPEILVGIFSPIWR